VPKSALSNFAGIQQLLKNVGRGMYPIVTSSLYCIIVFNGCGIMMVIIGVFQRS